MFTRDSINITIFGREVAAAAAAGLTYPTSFKKEFYDGTVGQSEWTTGLDVSRELSFAMPVTVAFGAENRRNKYFIRPGEPDSYDGGGFQLDLVAPREAGDVVASAEGQRLDGLGRLAAPRGDEAGTIAEEQVPHVVRTVVLVDH